MAIPTIGPERASMGRPLYLASRSPRRLALLRQLGFSPEVLAVDLDEAPLPGECPTDYVRRLAVAKAGLGHQRLSSATGGLVLGADTAVVLDGQVLGKPADREGAVAMLLGLAGRTHQVLTGVALVEEGTVRYRLSLSWVRFRALDRAEVETYWETGEPADKAGAYAIQGLGALFVADLMGSHSGVVGLPLFETGELLREAGLDPWSARRQAPDR